MSSSVHRQLAEPLVLRVDRLHAGQVQHRVEQHRRVAHRQHEAIAVRPDRIVGIEAQELLPETVGHRRHRHRRARMPEFAACTASIDSVRMVLMQV